MPKNVVAVVLVVLIIIAIGVIIKTQVVESKGKAYDEVYNKEIQVLDVKTGQKVTVKQGEWEQEYKTDPNTQYKTDPKSGNPLSVILACHACKAEIPAAPMAANMEPEQMEKVTADYKCPKCGKAAYQPMEPPK